MYVSYSASLCTAMLLNLFRGPGVLLEGVYQKRVKHIVQDTGGKKVSVINRDTKGLLSLFQTTFYVTMHINLLSMM